MRWINISLHYLIAGHHAGLADWHPSDIDHGLSVRLARPQAKAEYAEALQGLAKRRAAHGEPDLAAHRPPSPARVG